VTLALILSSVEASGQSQRTAADQSPWKQLSIEELLDIDVTTAARRPDSIRRAAAPVQVLTGEDLHRAGIRYLSDALRLADAFYVGRFDGRTWVVNTRGLNINGANKLQVMIPAWPDS
jgi:iron complex outermembrane receptor protein